MAQEVQIAGALFSDVPSIRVPDSNNIYHPFVDPSITTATASDVARDKVFIATDGTETTGTGIRLPFNYQEVEYIESSDGAMMEIPYNLKGNTEMDLKILYTGSATGSIGIMGNTNAGTGSLSNPKYIFTSSSSGASVAYYYCSAYKPVSPTFDLVTDGVCRIETKIENGKFMIYLNGVANTQSAPSEVSVTCPQNTTIFGIAGGRYKDQRVYWCRFYENGTEMVNLVPCYRVSDGEIGMYDMVSNTFLTNGGSGSFSKGSDVSPTGLTSASGVSF